MPLVQFALKNWEQKPWLHIVWFGILGGLEEIAGEKCQEESFRKKTTGHAMMKCSKRSIFLKNLLVVIFFGRVKYELGKQ